MAAAQADYRRPSQAHAEAVLRAHDRLKLAKADLAAKELQVHQASLECSSAMVALQDLVAADEDALLSDGVDPVPSSSFVPSSVSA